jgi:hypothetical protein
LEAILIDKSFLDVANSIRDVRKTETILPIARKNCLVTPFLLGEHQTLKTAILSPQSYDRELVKILYKHQMIVEKDESGNFANEIKLKYEEFVSQISNIDKIMLLWACYRSTYENLGIRKITCPKCKTEASYKITLDELIQSDSLTIWETDDLPFYQYEFPIEVDYDKYKYNFKTSIPTIKRYNQVLGMIPIEKIKENLEANSVLSRSEELSMLTTKITILKDGTELASSNNIQETLVFFNTALPSSVSEEFQTKYNERFEKYLPKFYTFLNCANPDCKNEIKYSVDIETEFFRRVLLGREFVEEEL